MCKIVRFICFEIVYGALSRKVTQKETILEIENTKADAIIYAYETPEFFSTSANDFLTLLNDNFNPIAIVCGEDYTFGKGKSGTVETLKDFCKINNIKLNVTPMVLIDGLKVSSTTIKELIISGNVEKANQLLGKKYYISGIIMHAQ